MVWTALGKIAITIVNKDFTGLQDSKDSFEGLAKFFPTLNKINNISNLSENSMGGKQESTQSGEFFAEFGQLQKAREWRQPAVRPRKTIAIFQRTAKQKTKMII